MIKINFKTIAIGLIGTVFLAQAFSLILSALFPTIPVLRAGTAILILLAAIATITLFVVGMNINELKSKETMIYFLIILTITGLAFWKGSEYLPQIFSISPVSETIKNTIGSIFGGVR